jgi:hypothetical protein
MELEGNGFENILYVNGNTWFIYLFGAVNNSWSKYLDVEYIRNYANYITDSLLLESG